jgi:hypothetical protein
MIDRCVDRHVNRTDHGHFDKGCSEHDESRIATSAVPAMDRRDESVLTPSRKSAIAVGSPRFDLSGIPRSTKHRPTKVPSNNHLAHRIGPNCCKRSPLSVCCRSVLLYSRRCVGPPRAADLGLRASVERTGAENAPTRIHLGVSDRCAQPALACAWRRDRSALRRIAKAGCRIAAEMMPRPTA